VTAFTVTRNGSMWLMARHARLGMTRWELPGGHMEPGETLEQTAGRETSGETDVEVQVGGLLATLRARVGRASAAKALFLRYLTGVEVRAHRPR
jgi:ADP-ribose pyrophosphatase YjhB (NUDIX family)